MSKRDINDELTTHDLESIIEFQKAVYLDLSLHYSDTPNALRRYLAKKEHILMFFKLLCMSLNGERHIFGGNGKTLCNYKVITFISTVGHEIANYCNICMNTEIKLV